jgi:rhodanese-related sulfurtransferase
VAPPLAGATRLGWTPFLLWNALGIAIWAGAAIGAGALFAAQIGGLLARLEAWGALALQAIAALLALYVALKWWERRRFYKMLRVARIGVDELRGLIHGGQRPIVVDVRSAASRRVDPRFIPGAVAMDSEQVEQQLEQLPADRDIVFYCDCPNEASAAQVAKKLIELGYTRVRPLHGGLDAWIAAGHDVETKI